ncbi:hypothetical protein QQ008_00380 [Fulvivirgaceae bacterium BMA10]|uniref:Uncharacterized protein n=1 Tax=Splendidivirga corallicola TaxID=3051826 RepID=A0ABT8KHR5_9BACT|nr:hypothetical protein [Fulvivirgaceae bacterium BMA10]
MSEFCLEKIRMNVVETAPNGVVNLDTIFTFSQQDGIVSAEYAGGKIQKGFLIGSLMENHLTFSYCQLQTNGKLDNGSSSCELKKMENGKIQMIENFQWATRENQHGTNVFQEL